MMWRTLAAMAGLMATVIGAAWMLRTPGDAMLQLADRAARRHAGLDYSEASIARLDAILTSSDEKLLGAYFGEVIRRRHGGIWISEDILETKGVQVAVQALVRQRVLDRSGTATLDSHYEALLRDWSR
jgi:uncharacterized membrane protein